MESRQRQGLAQLGQGRHRFTSQWHQEGHRHPHHHQVITRTALKTRTPVSGAAHSIPNKFRHHQAPRPHRRKEGP